MAERRMFAKTIIDSDAFIDMPATARLLYYDLSMRADDDGFINNPKKILRMTSASDDDLKVLIAQKFVITFEDGIVVIKHWLIHNYIRKDTYNETLCKEQKSMLIVDENKVYKLIDTDRRRAVDEPSTQVRLGKDRLDKDNIYIPACEGEPSSAATVKASEIHQKNSLKDEELQSVEELSAKANEIYERNSLKDEELQNLKKITAKASKHKYGKYKNVLLKDEELQNLKATYPNWQELIDFLDEYIEMKGYRAKCHYLCFRHWVVDAVKRKNAQYPNSRTQNLKNYEYKGDDTL